MVIDDIRGQLRQRVAVLDAMLLDPGLLASIERAADLCVEALQSGRKILLAGNGGSAADAQHIAGEFVSRFAYDRPGLAAFALTVDTSVLTAIGNDYGYDMVFARQVEAVGVAGDALIAISTSGRSPNILKGLEKARMKGLRTIGLTGAGGDAMAGLCDLLIRIPSTETPRIQEGHITVGHIISGIVEARCFPR
jgi:D-sedoheptulose 7-phosphate isomerase